MAKAKKESSNEPTAAEDVPVDAKKAAPKKKKAKQSKAEVDKIVAANKAKTAKRAEKHARKEKQQVAANEKRAKAAKEATERRAAEVKEHLSHMDKLRAERKKDAEARREKIMETITRFVPNCQKCGKMLLKCTCKEDALEK